jgi:hypothetical protein
MSWYTSTKLRVVDGSVAGALTVPVSCKVLAQTASASADYETAIWSASSFTAMGAYRGLGSNAGTSLPFTGDTSLYVILGAYLITDSAVTGGGATVQATAKIRLYDSAGVLVGTLFSLLFASGVNTVAFAEKSLGAGSTTVRSITNGNLIRKDETLTFEWLQSGTTGLALPAAVVVLDIV